MESINTGDTNVQILVPPQHFAVKSKDREKDTETEPVYLEEGAPDL